MPEINRVIVALDYDDHAKAWELVERLGEASNYYKVGLQLLTAAGPAFVRKLVDANKRVFLDLKTFEIPNSVAGAVDAAGALGVSMVTVHASGGSRALDAAVIAAQPYPELTVLGLTVVTSMTNSDLKQVGIHSSIEQQVLRLAHLAVNAGCKGLVASTHETKTLRSKVPASTVIVTPGIQLNIDNSTDQQRVASPRQAIDAGASFVVIGRAISQADSPVDAFARATLETD